MAAYDSVNQWLLDYDCFGNGLVLSAVLKGPGITDSFDLRLLFSIRMTLTQLVVGSPASWLKASVVVAYGSVGHWLLDSDRLGQGLELHAVLGGPGVARPF